MIYLNRGLFVASYEAENNSNKEINSVIEWVLELITGEDNGIDEDGDEQTDCNFTQIILYNVLQCVQMDIFSKNMRKNIFSYKGNFLLNDFCSLIDHPPEMI